MAIKMKRYVKITGSATSPKTYQKPDTTGKILMPKRSTDKPGVKVLMPKKSTDKPAVRVNMGGEPAVRKYNPKLEPGIKTKARPRITGPKKSGTVPQPLTPQKGPRPVRPLPKRKGTPVRKKML